MDRDGEEEAGEEKKYSMKMEKKRLKTRAQNKGLVGGKGEEGQQQH